MDVNDAKAIRRQLEIGQIIYIEKEVLVETSGRTHTMRETAKAEVIKKYSHIVEIMPLGKKEALPRRTVTYAEILALN